MSHKTRLLFGNEFSQEELILAALESFGITALFGPDTIPSYFQ